MEQKTLAFEIGCEELPAFDLHAETERFASRVDDALSAANVPHGSVEAYTTPRRLAAVVTGIPSATEASSESFRGPAASIAFGDDGAPTQAAVGFARGKGIDPSQLEVRDEDGTDYVYATVDTPAVEVATLLPDLLSSVVASISWPKSQRWGSREEEFSRPVRWLFALFGDEVIPFQFAGLVASSATYGHRTLAPGPHEVASADAFVDVLRASSVVPSEQERESSIRSQVEAIEHEVGLVAQLPPKTLAEVVNLVEFPTVLVGTFDELFLDVPKEITVDAMLMHQRYFPLYQPDGSLSNRFLVTSNGDPAFSDRIVEGNERVVAARLYDAKFFYDEDVKLPLESYVDRLSSVVFQEQLGSTREKTDRIVGLAKHLCADAGTSEQERSDALRAAYLCKADLVTSAVVEFTSVQGVMGSYYAAASGENDAVARAIEQHYRPRFAGDDIPDDAVGQIVAVADKIDTICGLFAIGQAPTGSSDPFALRRSALGVIAILEGGLPVSLVPAIDVALDAYAEQGVSFDHDQVRSAVADFFVTRTKVGLRDEGCSADAVEAVLSAGVVEPFTIATRVHALEEARVSSAEVMDDLATAFARANNLRDASLGTDVDTALLTPPEGTLLSAIEAAEGRVRDALSGDDYAEALSALASLRAPVDDFFDAVMVMDEDEALKNNRLRILNRFVGVFSDVADFGLLARM